MPNEPAPENTSLRRDSGEGDEPEGALLRYWRAQPGSAVLLLVATFGCAFAAPFLDIFPDGFGIVRRVFAGALIGWGFGMLPIAHRLWD